MSKHRVEHAPVRPTRNQMPAAVLSVIFGAVALAGLGVQKLVLAKYSPCLFLLAWWLLGAMAIVYGFRAREPRVRTIGRLGSTLGWIAAIISFCLSFSELFQGGLPTW